MIDMEKRKGRFALPDGSVRRVVEAQTPWDADDENTLLVVLLPTGQFTVAPHVASYVDTIDDRQVPEDVKISPLPTFDTLEETSLYAQVINASRGLT